MSANANDMTLLLKKIERRLGLIPITPHLPKEFQREAWADTVKTDTVTISDKVGNTRICPVDVYLDNTPPKQLLITGLV